MTKTDDGSPSCLWPCLVRGGVLTLVLTSLRALILFAMERVAHGDELDHVLERIATALPATLVDAGVAGLLLSCCATGTQSVQPGLRRAALSGALALAASVVIWLLLGGWAGDDYSRRIGFDTARGRQVAAALAVVSVMLGALLTLVRPRPATWRSPLALGAALALIGLAVPALTGGHGSHFVFLEPVDNLLSRPGRWSTDRGEPRVDLLTPSRDYKRDGADMPALILSPPATARLDLGPNPGRVRLQLRAGIDVSVIEAQRGAQREALAGCAVSFKVALDGVTLFEDQVAIPAPAPPLGSDWLDIAGRGGLDVSAGGVLTLSTTLTNRAGAEVSSPAPLAVGFGGLKLERAWNVERQRSAPEAPNILFIVMDTQRRDRIGAYGYERPTTPSVDALAARGVTFDAAYSTASWTWPSTASMLTGMSPVEHGVVGTGSCYLADELTTLAEALQQEGFTTAAWSGNPLIVPDKNFDQGFESFESGKALMRRSRVFLPGALEWLDAIEDRRFFLYLHLVDPHAPYDPHPDARELLAGDVPADFGKDTLHDLSQRLLRGEGRNADGELDLDSVAPPELRRQIDAMYDASVRTGDRWVGRVLDKLRDLHLDDRTIVVFTSDHGEELFQHGHAAHGQGLHTELVGVPLIIAGPGIPAGQRVSVPISNRHLAPTLARLGGFELTGLDAPVDLLSLVGAAPTGDERVGFSTDLGWWNGVYPTPIYGLRRGPLVVHVAPKGGPWGALARAEDGDLSLYDLQRDPGEERDLSGELPEAASSMRDELLRRIEASVSRRSGPAFGAGRSTVDMLRALGYVGEEDHEAR